jgi:hypothetical protein
VISDSNRRELLERTTGATPDCLPAERLGEALTEPERAHVSACPHCRTELALWQAFEQSIPSPEDGAAVQWIAAETARRFAPKPPRAGRGFGWLRWPQLAAAAATLVLAAAAGYTLWDPEPRVQPRQDAAAAYRTGRVQLVAPTGDVPGAPRVLEWSAFSGAASYDVNVLEVDRTPLWHGSALEPRIDLPPAIVALFVPGKTVTWEVTARDAAGTAVGESGPRQFRVTAAPSRQRVPGR